MLCLFFLLLQHCKIAKAKKQAFFKLNNCQKNFSIACAEQQNFIILHSCNFACKYKKITEILSFWIGTNFSFFDWFEFFCLFVFALSCCRGWHCFQFVLKFLAKMSLVFEKIILIKVVYSYCCRLARLNISLSVETASGSQCDLLFFSSLIANMATIWINFQQKFALAKVNLHSIRFSSVFLSFGFSLEKYALFHPHFYKSISALSRLLHIGKNFVQKFCVWTTRAIFQNRAVPFYKKVFFGKLLSSVWLYGYCGYGLIKMRMKKCILFQEEAKT